MDKWIRMTERLPDPGVEVLVYWFNRSTWTGYREVMDRDGPAWNGIEQRAYLELIAWQPLPDPPPIRIDRKKRNVKTR